MRDWEGLDEAVAIADAGSFVGAAALLDVSTSHVSRVLARLEDRVGVTLFNRTTRRVSPTDAGISFIDHARRLIHERDELLALTRGDDEPQGQLRITCSIAMGERFIAPIVGAFAEAHPRLSVVIDLTNRMTDIIAEGYDVAIRTGEISDQRLAARLLARRRLMTVATAAYLAQAGTPECVDDLPRHQCLCGTAQAWRFMESGRPRLFTPQGRWRCNNGTAVVDFALASRGICQLPAFYVNGHVRERRLAPVLAASEAPPESIWLVTPQRRQFLPKVRRLADRLEAELQAALDAA